MAAFPNSGAAYASLIQPAATRCEDANGIPALLKNTYFSTLECIERSLLRGFRRAPSRSLAAAPTKNIENNPMQSSRRPPQPAVWAENLTRRANQRHNFIIPEFAKRRARNIDAIGFAWLDRWGHAAPLARTCRSRENAGLFQNLSGESHADEV